MASPKYFALLLLCSLSQLTVYGHRDTITTVPDFRGRVIPIPFKFLQEKVIRNEASFAGSSGTETVFKREVSFFGTHFLSLANFSEAHFANRAIFQEARFKSSAYFSGAHFDSLAYFFRARFHGIADFSNAYFSSRAEFSDFSRARFDSTAYFYGTHFDNRAEFYVTQFANKAYFTKAHFTSSSNFFATVLPDTLYLQSLQLDSLKVDIDFRGSELDSAKNRKCLVFLKGTDISKLIMPAHLFKAGFEFDEQESKQTRLDEITRVYEQLIKKCKDLGIMSSVQGWDIEYKQRVNEQYLFGGLLNCINLHWWNFGYDKWRILWIWLPVCYFVFFLANFWKLNWMVKSVYHDEELGKNFNLTYDGLNTTRQRVSYALFYTAAIYFNFKLRHEAVNYKNLGGLMYLYLIYCVGTLHVAFGVLGYILKE